MAWLAGFAIKLSTALIQCWTRRHARSYQAALAYYWHHYRTGGLTDWLVGLVFD
jgi:hypothetical protein